MRDRTENLHGVRAFDRFGDGGAVSEIGYRDLAAERRKVFALLLGEPRRAPRGRPGAGGPRWRFLHCLMLQKRQTRCAPCG